MTPASGPPFGRCQLSFENKTIVIKIQIRYRGLFAWVQASIVISGSWRHLDGISAMAPLVALNLATVYRILKKQNTIQSIIWASAWDFEQLGMFDQQSLRSACAYAQSDQSLC